MFAHPQQSDVLNPQPWRALPGSLAELLRPTVPTLVDETVEQFHAIDDYDKLLAGPFGEAIRANSELMLERFLDLIADPETDDSEARRHYVEMGRIEYRQGRTLDALMASYRLMGRLAWRRFTDLGARSQLEPEVLYRLGEALFAYIDGLSAESVEGFAEAQIADVGERERARQDLVSALCRHPPASARELTAIAEQAGWGIPVTVAAVAAPAHEQPRLTARMGVDVLVATPADDDTAIALVPDPDGPGRRTQMRRSLRGLGATVGPAVSWRDGGRSIERAVAVRRLLARGELQSREGPVASEDHLLALLLDCDPELAQELAAKYLRPLEALPERSRARLSQTLRVWLDHSGKTEEVARRLEVHPQTVRYRLKALRKLYGKQLDDADQRLAIAVALRARERPEAP